MDPDRLAQASKLSLHIQEELWEDVIEMTKRIRSAVMASYMSSLNEIIDLHGKRWRRLKTASR